MRIKKKQWNKKIICILFNFWFELTLLLADLSRIAISATKIHQSFPVIFCCRELRILISDYWRKLKICVFLVFIISLLILKTIQKSTDLVTLTWLFSSLRYFLVIGIFGYPFPSAQIRISRTRKNLVKALF